MLRMCTLGLTGIIAVALGTAGCGGRGGGSFQASWGIGWYGDGPTDCQTAGVAVVSLDVADSYDSRIVFNDEFNCLDYGGISASLPPSDYTVALRAWESRSASDPLSEVVFPVPYPIYSNTVTTLPPTRLDVLYH